MVTRPRPDDVIDQLQAHLDVVEARQPRTRNDVNEIIWMEAQIGRLWYGSSLVRAYVPPPCDVEPSD